MKKIIDDKLINFYSGCTLCDQVSFYYSGIGDNQVEYLCQNDISYWWQLSKDDRKKGESIYDWKCKVYCLFLENNKITSNGVLHLIPPKWSSLRLLHLDNNKIGNQGCKYLSRASISMDILKTLFLSQNELEYAGVSHLAKGKWKQLQNLNLCNKVKIQNQITSATIQPFQLLRGTGKKLSFISLCQNKLTATECFQLLLLQIDFCGYSWREIVCQKNTIDLWELQAIIKTSEDKIYPIPD